jgi:hypothetical protein
MQMHTLRKVDERICKYADTCITQSRCADNYNAFLNPYLHICKVDMQMHALHKY